MDTSLRLKLRSAGRARAGVRALVIALMAVLMAVLTPLRPRGAAIQDPPAPFQHWSAATLKAHDAELSRHVGADHSSRETLADFGSHRFRMLYRDADGNPEQHDGIIDIVMVQSGSGTLMLGGTMEGRRATSASEWVGTRLTGGELKPLGPGDILHIPAGVPHSFLVQRGGHLTYVLLKIPKS